MGHLRRFLSHPWESMVPQLRQAMALCASAQAEGSSGAYERVSAGRRDAEWAGCPEILPAAARTMRMKPAHEVLPPASVPVLADPRLRHEEGCVLGPHVDDELPLGAGLWAKTKKPEEEAPRRHADGRADG